eukprot:CAMPEP_0113483856 /NCGR_PEP_ID=MMETSP0014_2-20120614/23654_1 /TAXON_ID=2857 /ORGANISM="Nitzschia sp." /LENGTH=1246 /DNA_ID=CAMNT_0000377425 /DNA_START=1013 /DNA_END=4753 /DNA_ORIENTATION=- /assembly_acc=CAM_ASM_000159
MSQASRSGKDNGRYHPPTNNQGYTIPKTLVFPNGMNAQVVIDRVMKNEEIVIKQQQNGLKSDADVKELALKGLLTSEQYGQYLDTICKRETFVREHVTYSNKMCSKFFDMNQVDQSPKKTPPPAGEVTGELPVDFANMESPSLHAPHVRSPIDSQKAAQDQFNDTKQNKLRRRQKSDLQIAKERSMDRSFQVAKERQLKSKKEEEARKKEQAEAKKMEQEKHHQTVKAALEKQKASAEPVSSGKTRVKRGVPSGPEVPNVARGVDLNNKRTDIPTGSNKKKRLTNFLNESMAAESAPAGSGPPDGGSAGGAGNAATGSSGSTSALSSPAGSGPPDGGSAGGAGNAATGSSGSTSALSSPAGSGPPDGGSAGGADKDVATGPNQFESVMPSNGPVVCASHISFKTGKYRGACCGDVNGIIKATEHKCSKCDGALHSIMCSYTKAPVLLCYHCAPHNQRKEIRSQRQHLLKSDKPPKPDVQECADEVCASHKNIEGTVCGHCACDPGGIIPFGTKTVKCPSCQQVMHSSKHCAFDVNDRCYYCADPVRKEKLLRARTKHGMYEYNTKPAADESDVASDTSEDDDGEVEEHTDDEGDVVMHEGRVPVNEDPIHPDVEIINQVEDSASDNNAKDHDQNSYKYRGVSAQLLIQENPIDGPSPIVIKNFGCDDFANDIYTWETFIDEPRFIPRLTGDPENLQFLFEFGEGIIASNDENKKLCHDRWHKNKIDTLISLERKSNSGCGQLYIASDGENAHYECFLRDIILAIAEYPSEIQVHLYLRELSYHTQRMLVINDQKWLKSRIARIDWDKTREEMEIKLKRKVTENDVKADKNSRQAGKNYVDYGLCSQRNSTPLKQWNKEAQDEGICTPVEHNRSDEPNQKKNFKELSDLLREIKCLKWLTDEDGNYVSPISYFEDDTSAASRLQKDNVWHSYRTFLSFQRNKNLLQLCGCHGDRFNSKRKGRKIVFSFSHMLFKGVREGLIAYMREGIEICEEKLPLYKATNDRIYDLYSNTPSYLLDLVVQTWKDAETYQDPYVGFPMKRSKPNMDHTGYVQPVLHMIILLTKEFNINSVGLLGICLAWIQDPGSAYYMCAAGAILLNRKNMHSDFLSIIDADPYLFSFFFVMLTDRVIEESDQKKYSDIWRLTTYVSRLYVDQDTGKVVMPRERCRIHFGKDFNKWKDDVNYLFFVCAYVSHLFKEAPIQKDRHTVGSKVTDLLSDKMGSCGRLVVGHFITLLTILGFLPMHFKD